MIIYTYLMGGLGNQMFQAAAGLSYAIDHCSKAYFLTKDLPACKDYKTTIFKYLPICKKPLFYYLYNEPECSYIKIPYAPKIKIYGYFQSEKYFINNKDAIIKFFKTCSLRADTQKKISDNLAKINYAKTISIHVRRGDYLHLQDLHPVQNEQYYDLALTTIAHKLGFTSTNATIILNSKYKFVIYSDDIEWCRNSKFFASFNCHFMEGNEDYVDMYVMSMCTHHIIANSSFSWWGAYLNEKSDKLVVAPKIWFGPSGPAIWEDLYCDNWLRV